jgi:protein phosphatase
MMCSPRDRALFEQWGMLFAVADGMGGASAGELASRLALETIVTEYYTALSETIPTRLRDALAAANRTVFVESENDPNFHGMGTTVSTTVIHGDCAYIAQVGDSRVYIKRADEPVIQVTNDHSLVAEQVRNGFLSAEEAKTHSLKNLITRAVGIRDSVKTDLFALKIRANDTILICSDGLTNFVEDKDIVEAMMADSLQGVARMLVGHALNGGGSDNITAVLIRITKEPPERDMQAGATEVPIEKQGLFRKMKTLLKNRKA